MLIIDIDEFVDNVQGHQIKNILCTNIDDFLTIKCFKLVALTNVFIPLIIL